MNADLNEQTKVLVITRNFPPRLGGMERLNWHVVDELAKQAAVRVVVPRGAAATALPAKVTVNEVPLSPLWRFFFSAFRKSLSIAFQWRPDIVFAGSGLTAPIAWLTARACGARCYAYVHGLDLTVPNLVYRHSWLPVMRRLDGAIANSRATATIADREGIAGKNIKIVHPGVKLSEVDSGARTRYRAKRGWGERKVLLSVGRLTRRKGLLEFIRHSLPAIVHTYPDCLLIIIGDIPKAALYAEAVTPEAIYAVATESHVRDNIEFIGSQPDNVLADLFLAADVHIFPVQDRPNDPEGFGMVAVEAAAHGLPTVAFAVGGVTDAVEDGASGALVSRGDFTGFADAVIELLRASPDPRSFYRCRGFASRYGWKHFGEALWTAMSGN